MERTELPLKYERYKFTVIITQVSPHFPLRPLAARMPRGRLFSSLASPTLPITHSANGFLAATDHKTLLEAVLPLARWSPGVCTRTTVEGDEFKMMLLCAQPGEPHPSIRYISQRRTLFAWFTWFTLFT